MSDNGMRMLYNAMALICCTLLAIALGKWWLIFLILLFYINRD